MAKLISFTSLLLMWLCLLGLPTDFDNILLGISTVSMSYFFGRWLDLIPNTIKFNLHLIFYFLWLIKEIIKSSISVVKIILRKDMNLNPVFEWIDSGQKNDLGIVVYANSITLTPGTVTVDIKNNMLLIHALEQASIDDLKNGKLTMAKRVNKIIQN